jgi:hypothetical protein
MEDQQLVVAVTVLLSALLGARWVQEQLRRHYSDKKVISYLVERLREREREMGLTRRKTSWWDQPT